MKIKKRIESDVIDMKVGSDLINKIKDNYMMIFCIYFITIFLDITTLKIDYPICEIICKFVRYITYILFLVRLILIFPNIKRDIKKIKINKRKVIIISLILLLLLSIVGNLIATGDKRLFFLFLVLISSYGVNCDDIIKNIMRMQIALTIIIVTLSLFGLTQNYIVYRGVKYRYSLGFSYTTSLSQLVMFFTLLFLYKRKFKIDFIQISYIQLINLFAFFITDSRTEFIFLEFIIFMSVIYNLHWIDKCNKIKKSFSNIFSHCFWTYPIISFLTVCMYPMGGIFFEINKLLSNRLLQTFGVLKQYGLTVFGSDIEFVGNGIVENLKYGTNITSNFVDNEYMQLLFTHGLLFIIVFTILLNIMLISLNKEHEYKKIFICFLYLTFGFLNPRIINLVYSPIPFIFIYEMINILKSDNKELNNEEFYN